MKNPLYSIAAARKKLGELVNLVRHSHQTVALGHYGKIEAYLIPAEALPEAQKTQSESTKKKELDLEKLFDRLTAIREAISVLEIAFVSAIADPSALRLPFWAGSYKVQEILGHVRAIHESLGAAGFDLERLKVFSKADFNILTELLSLPRIDTLEMERVFKFFPNYVSIMHQFLNSLAGQ